MVVPVVVVVAVAGVVFVVLLLPSLSSCFVAVRGGTARRSVTPPLSPVLRAGDAIDERPAARRRPVGGGRGKASAGRKGGKRGLLLID